MSDDWSVGSEKSAMRLTNPKAALEKLYEFRDLQEIAARYPYTEVPSATKEAVDDLLPLVEDIARSLGELKRVRRIAGWPYGAVRRTTGWLISIVEQRDDYQRIFGPSGPTLTTNGLHPWVWHAVVNLWDGGHYKQAVNAAASAVEEQTQVKLDREDLGGTKLYAEAFRLDTKTGERRLRFANLTEVTADGKRTQTWKSAHQGAMHLGQGCVEGIRNINAHGTRDLTEQEALEYLAALSVLARWVDECKVVGVPENAKSE